MAGTALAGLAALFVYDRGYNTGCSDARDGRPKYDSNRIRNGILCDIARCFILNSIADKSVHVFNKVRDNMLEHYDTASSPVVSNEARVCATMDILKKVNDFLDNPTVTIKGMSTAPVEPNQATTKENKLRGKKRNPRGNIE